MPLTGKQVASHVLALFLMYRLTGSKKPKRGRTLSPVRPNVLNKAKNFFMAKGFA